VCHNTVILMILPVLSRCWEMSVVRCLRFICNICEAFPVSSLEVPGSSTYESGVLCCRVRGIMAITGLCSGLGSFSIMRFVFALTSLDGIRSGVVWVQYSPFNAGIKSLRATLPDDIFFYLEFCFLNRAFR
jgi:hypothetical protein